MQRERFDGRYEPPDQPAAHVGQKSWSRTIQRHGVLGALPQILDQLWGRHLAIHGGERPTHTTPEGMDPQLVQQLLAEVGDDPQ